MFFQNILSQVQTLPHCHHLLVNLPFMTQHKAQKASDWYFLYPIGIFYGVFIWFRFWCASENRPFVLPFGREVHSPRNSAQKEITQLLPEARPPKRRPSPTTTSSQEITAQRTDEPTLGPYSSLLGSGSGEQGQEGHIFMPGLRKSLTVCLRQGPTCSSHSPNASSY